MCESLDTLAKATVACAYAIPAGTAWELPRDMLAAVRSALDAQPAIDTALQQATADTKISSKALQGLQEVSIP